MPSKMLPFHRDIIEEIAPPDHDDLLILGKGMGLRRILCTMMKIYDSEHNLIILVGATPAEEAGIGELLSTLGVRRPGLHVLTHEMGSKARKELYLKGGLFSVTSRILIVDLLKKDLPPEMITGLMVLHAEQVNQTSLEAFIVRIYRQSNHSGFLKAFSDEAESFSASMTPLTTCMKQLSLRRVTLWPRFRDEVHDSLGERKADIIELYQPLTRQMGELQTAIVECMEDTLNGLRKACAHHKVDLEDITIDNAHFKNFDRIVRSKLDPIWHTVGANTKRLVQDLTTLRNLLSYLLTYDAVTFNSHLEAIRLASGSMDGGSAASGFGAKNRPDQSPWLSSTAAQTLFHIAKRRAYIPPPPKSARSASEAMTDGFEEEMEALRDVEREEAGGGDSRWPPGVVPVLEELPKWGLLSSVLDEIEEEIQSIKSEGRSDMPGSNTILVMASSARACTQLREYLSTREATKAADGKPSHTAGRSMMERLLRTYFWWKGSLGEMNRNYRGGKAKSKSTPAATTLSVPGRGGLAPRGQPDYKRRRTRGGGSVGGAAGSARAKATADNTDEGLEDEAEEIADFLYTSSQQFLEDDAVPSRGPSTTLPSIRSATPSPAFFREPSMATASAVAPRPIPSSRAESEVPELVRVASEAPSVSFSEISHAPAPQALLRPSAQASSTNYFDVDDFDSYFGLLEPDDMVVVRSYKGEDEEQILEELRPRFVVMYEPDPAFVRRIEVYRSSHPGLAVRVYFMLYVESTEESKYLTAVTREKLAFERLIREKGTMIIPLTGDPRGAPTAPTSQVDSLAKKISTRMAGGARDQQAAPATVIIDVREFRSTLPSILHLNGMLILPVTLQVGDYILSPEMCVERKSIPDLVQSFTSGRLYTQCETMSVHYKQPILLIEFEENKSFSLQTMVESKRPAHQQNKKDTSTPQNADLISPHEIQSKLVLLTLHFPRLRIIWSSSPFATANIFGDLKNNHDEPSEEKAVTVGQGDDGAEGDAAGSNSAAIEMLRLIPGVSVSNLRHVMNNIKSLQHMCSLSRLELEKIMGSEQASQAYQFLHNDVQKRGGHAPGDY